MAKEPLPQRAGGTFSRSIQYRDYELPETDPNSKLTANVLEDGTPINMASLPLDDPDFNPFTDIGTPGNGLRRHEIISWVIADVQAKASIPGLTRLNLEVGFFYLEDDELEHGKQWDSFIGSKKYGLHVAKSMEQVWRFDQVPEEKGRDDIFTFLSWFPDIEGERFRVTDILRVVQV